MTWNIGYMECISSSEMAAFVPPQHRRKRESVMMKAVITNAALLALLAGCSDSTVADSARPEVRTKPDSVFHPETGEPMYILPPNWNPTDLESISGDHTKRRERLADRIEEMRVVEDSIK